VILLDIPNGAEKGRKIEQGLSWHSEPLRNVCKLFSMELVEHRQANGQIALIRVCHTVGTPVKI